MIPYGRGEVTPHTISVLIFSKNGPAPTKIGDLLSCPFLQILVRGSATRSQCQNENPALLI